MSTPKNTRTIRTPGRSLVAPPVATVEEPAVLVSMHLHALGLDYTAALRRTPRSDAEQAARCRTLALLAARRTGWWRVLRRAILARPDQPLLYADALYAAEARERSTARFWRESAADWQARADGRPTSDAAGALSNWHKLGISG